MAKDTGLKQRSHEDRFKSTFLCNADHMHAYAGLGMRSAFHHQGFTTPKEEWLEVWWTTDTRTGAVMDIFEDTRGLNRR
jgi:hypothetical protein